MGTELAMEELPDSLWSDDISSFLPWCFFEELQNNGGRPDTRWAENLPWQSTGRQTVNVLEPLPTKFDSDWWVRPYCCYLSTVIFYSDFPRGSCNEIARVEYIPRGWPHISFVERCGDFYEVQGGSVVHVFGRWQMEYCCYRNTDYSRHFNLRCDSDCRVCRILKAER